MEYEYRNFDDETVLRDHLAYDRTKVALTRTFLAIERTGLSLLASGAGLIITRGSNLLVAIGYFLLFAALAVMVVGCVYGLRTKRRIDSLAESRGMRHSKALRHSKTARRKRAERH